MSQERLMASNKNDNKAYTNNNLGDRQNLLVSHLIPHWIISEEVQSTLQVI